MPTTTPNKQTTRFAGMMRQHQVADAFNVTTKTLRTMIHEGRFPPPDLRLSKRTILWRQDTLDAVAAGRWDSTNLRFKD